MPGLRGCFLTPCLQTQMKTYRCPWCVSRTNHNILYFVHISRTCSLNPGLCLWKVRFSLAGCGFERSDFASDLGRRAGPSWAPIRPLNPCLNRSPGQTSAQGAEPVHFARTSVQVVDIQAERQAIPASAVFPHDCALETPVMGRTRSRLRRPAARKSSACVDLYLCIA